MELSKRRSIIGALVALVLACSLSLGAFASSTNIAVADEATDDNTIYLKAAASMRYSMGDGRTSGELYPDGTEKYEEGTILRAFEDEQVGDDGNPAYYVDARYESSGNLLTEMRAEYGDTTATRPGTQERTDVFISAAPAQMESAIGYEYITTNMDLLRNNVVLVTHDQSNVQGATFKNIVSYLRATDSKISLGNESVPAGNYARQIFANIGNWDEIVAGDYADEKYENVTEVLESIKAEVNDFGAVYQTDAYTALAETGKGRIVILDYDQNGINVVYPMGMISAETAADFGGSVENAELLYEFLAESEDAINAYEAAGFVLAAA